VRDGLSNLLDGSERSALFVLRHVVVKVDVGQNVVHMGGRMAWACPAKDTVGGCHTQTEWVGMLSFLEIVGVAGLKYCLLGLLPEKIAFFWSLRCRWQ
jgi:hypothetical protein